MQNQVIARRYQPARQVPVQNAALAATIRAATAQVRLARTKRPSQQLTVVRADTESRLS